MEGLIRAETFGPGRAQTPFGEDGGASSETLDEL